MATWDAVDHYFSGQGVVLLAERDELGNPKGFYPVGNVSDLKITVSTSTLEHKESHTGQRGTDLRLTTETKCALSMTMENFVAENLARCSRGLATVIDGATVTDEHVVGYKGAVSALKHIKVSAVTVSTDVAVPVALTAYPGTAGKWDYKINLANGSIMLNGDVATFDKLTAGDFNATTGKCPLLVDYTFADQVIVDGLTVGAKELFMRFEGLNTADENSPVVVEVFKFSTDPFKELALISDQVQSFVLDGSVLADTFREEGSKYFAVKKLN